MTLTSGTKLGPYDTESMLGAGGMGEVCRSRDARLNRTVAIKVLPKSFSADVDRLQRFVQEARAAAALNQPNILSIFDIGEEQGAPYIVSELLEGTTLREQLREGPLPFRKAIDCGVQVARGLAAAHEKGIVHRDLKPENIFLTEDGQVKILDFGLAKLTRPESSGAGGDAPTLQVNTEPGQVMGTVGYMAPEQVRGKAADHRADIFAFGSIFVRDALGEAGVSRRNGRRHDERNFERGAGGAFGMRAECSGAAGTDGAALPGEESRAAVSVGGRCSVQSGIAGGQFGEFADQRAGGDF